MSCLSFFSRIFSCQCCQSPNQTKPQPKATVPEVQKQAAKVERVSSISMPTSEVLQIINNRNSGIHIEMINPQIFIHQEFVSASSSSASIGQARSSTMKIDPLSELKKQQVQAAEQAAAIFSPAKVDPSHKIQASIGRARSSTMQITPLSEEEKQQEQAAQQAVIKEDDVRTIPMPLMTERPVHQVVKKEEQAAAASSSVKVDPSHKTQNLQELAPSASSSSQSNGVASPSREAFIPVNRRRNRNLVVHRVHHDDEILRKNQAHHNRVRSKSLPTPYVPRVVIRTKDEQNQMTTQTKYYLQGDDRYTSYASVARVYAAAMAPLIYGENNAASAEDSNKKS